MPIYEYECTNCDHTFEVQQKFSDKPRSRCPRCRSKVRRVIHPAGIIFKGSGWYINDSRPGSEQEKFKGDDKQPLKESGEPVTADAGASGDGEKAGTGKSSDGKRTEPVAGSKETSGNAAEPAKSKTKSDTAPASSSSDD